MRALVVTGPRRAAVEEVAEPTPGPSELLVEVERVGICGTDVELYTGQMAYLAQGVTHFPIRLGHEWAGRVVGVGSAEDEDWVGRRITGDTMLGCGHCDYCARGLHHVCPDRFEIGVRDGWPGALAEKVLVPTRFAHIVPENVSLAAAALVEPGGNALRAVRAAELEPGRRLLILGSGTIGLLAAQFALARGIEVHLAGVREGSLRLARELGVTNTRTMSSLQVGETSGSDAGPSDAQSFDAPSLDAHSFDAHSFDAVIDATSVAESPALAVRLVKPAGRVVLIGLSGTPSLIDTREVTLKDLTMVGVLSASPGLAGAIEEFASGAVVPDAIVSEVIGLDEVPDRLDGNRGPDAGPGPKVQVDPRRLGTGSASS